jgi:hypothetical protein
LRKELTRGGRSGRVSAVARVKSPDNVESETSKMKKSKQYLTVGEVSEMAPGRVLELGYDDFNRGRIRFEFLRYWEGGRNFRAAGMTTFEGEEGAIEIDIYSMGEVMCCGSGGERLFHVKSKPAKVVCPCCGASMRAGDSCPRGCVPAVV